MHMHIYAKNFLYIPSEYINISFYSREVVWTRIVHTTSIVKP